MQVFSDIMAEESEKRCNRKRFIAVAQHFKVDAVLVIFVGQPGDSGVDGYHEEDSDNARALSDWLLRSPRVLSAAYCFCSHGFR
jgi:hypothetical protein